MTTYFHGSRNETLSYYPAICFTSDDDSAATYGDYLHAVEINKSGLNILVIEMTDDELRAAIDDQEWPCDRQSQVDELVSRGYDAVAYTDVDESGDTHDCVRILTAEAFAAAVK